MSPVRRPNQRRVAIVGLLITVVSFSSAAATASGQASTSEVGEVAWSQLGDDIDGDANSPGFGTSVAVSDDGTRVVIGSMPAEPGTDELSYVQVHEWDGSAWQQLGNNITVTTAGFNVFGYSVAISGDGNRIAVGDPYGPDGYDIGAVGGAETGPEDSTPPGAVRVFDWDGSTWQQVGETIEGTGSVTEFPPEFFGWSVALSSNGERVIAGSTLQARAFDYDSVNGWTQTGNTIGSTDGVNGAVAISADGNRVAVGPGVLAGLFGVGEEFEGGEEFGGGEEFDLQVFDYDVSDGWIQVGSDFDGEGISGWSVAMSADGNRVVFTNVDISAESASVRVMDYIDGDWNQVGDTISATESSGDALGYSVAMSAEGTRIAFTGAFSLGSNLSETSYLQVGEWNGSAWGYDVELAPGLTLAMSADGNLIASGNVFAIFGGAEEQSPVLVYALPASVSFDADNGENAPVEISGDRGSDVTLPTSEPTRTGYTFLGWNTASDGSGTSYAAGDTYTLPASDGDTLYAQWQPIPTTTVPVEETPPAAEPAEPVSDTPTFTG